jgi:hypothetical protein
MDEQMTAIATAMKHLIDAWAWTRTAGSPDLAKDHPLNVARRSISAAQDQLEMACEYLLETRVSVKTSDL